MESFQKRWLPPFAIDCGANAKLEGRGCLKINKNTHDKYLCICVKENDYLGYFIYYHSILFIVFLHIFSTR